MPDFYVLCDPTGGDPGQGIRLARSEDVTEQQISDFCQKIENRCGTVRGIGPAVREALAKLIEGSGARS